MTMQSSPLIHRGQNKCCLTLKRSSNGSAWNLFVKMYQNIKIYTQSQSTRVLTGADLGKKLRGRRGGGGVVLNLGHFRTKIEHFGYFRTLLRPSNFEMRDLSHKANSFPYATI